MDTSPCATPRRWLAQRADLLVCEATYASADGELAAAYGHLTARDAGRIAAGGHAPGGWSSRKSCSATTPRAAQRLAGQAASAFGGEVVLARDLTRIPVPARPPSAAHKSTKFPIDEPARMPYE